MFVDILAVALPIITLTGVFTLVGLKGWANHQLRMEKARKGGDERLTEAIEQLGAEVAALREDVAEIQEHVDFTERVLSEVKARGLIGPPGSPE